MRWFSRNAARTGLSVLFVLVCPAHANHLTATIPVGTIELQVSPSQVDTTRATVNFSIPVNAMGSGVPQTMTNAAPIFFEAALRTTAGALRSITISVDSSVPLSSASTTATVPFSDFSWTSSSAALTTAACSATYGVTADFPAGAFTGAVAQTIATFTFAGGTKYCTNGLLTFQYANTRTLPAGTYTGTVTFRASNP